MKKIVVLMLFVSCVVLAQKTKVIQGSFESLNGITEYNVVFDYTTLPLHVDGYATEEEYLASVRQGYIDRKSGVFAGDEYTKMWHSDKEEKYLPKFVASFNKRFDGKIKVSKNSTSAKYTATIKTTYIHPGSMAPDYSNINASITITENTNLGTFI